MPRRHASDGKRYIVCRHHFPQIYHRISHTSQCRIDTYAHNVGNLLERQVLIVAQIDYLPLALRQPFHQRNHIAQHLLFHKHILHVVFTQIAIVQQVIIHIIIRQDVCPLQVSEMVYDQVVCYPHNPLIETSGFGILCRECF